MRAMRTLFFRLAQSLGILGICLGVLLVINAIFFTGLVWYEILKEWYPALIGLAIGFLIGTHLNPPIDSKSKTGDPSSDITGRHSSGI